MKLTNHLSGHDELLTRLSQKAASGNVYFYLLFPGRATSSIHMAVGFLKPRAAVGFCSSIAKILPSTPRKPGGWSTGRAKKRFYQFLP